MVMTAVMVNIKINFHTPLKKITFKSFQIVFSS